MKFLKLQRKNLIKKLIFNENSMDFLNLKKIALNHFKFEHNDNIFFTYIVNKFKNIKFKYHEGSRK